MKTTKLEVVIKIFVRDHVSVRTHSFSKIRTNPFFLLHAVIYDMKNQKKITLRSGFFRKEVNDKYEFNTVYYKFTEFLTNGDLVTYKEINVDKFHRKSVILIYD